MTLQNMLSDLWWRARDVVGNDPLGGSIPREVFVLKLNQAQDKLAELGLIQEYYDTVASVAEQHEYLLPDYCLELKIVSVMDTDASDIYKPIPAIEYEYLNKTNQSWRGESSKVMPDFYYQVGLRLGFYPAFDASTASAIRIDYDCLPDTLSDNDDVSMILGVYHECVVLEAFCSMFPEHKETPKYLKQLEREYARMYRRTTKPKSGERTIVTLGDD